MAKLMNRSRVANLIALDSPNGAFYRLRLIVTPEGIFVEKESGARGKVYDTRKWQFDDEPSATKAFEQKLKSKLSHTRKSSRHYSLSDRLGEDFGIQPQPVVEHSV